MKTKVQVPKDAVNGDATLTVILEHLDFPAEIYISGGKVRHSSIM